MHFFSDRIENCYTNFEPDTRDSDFLDLQFPNDEAMSSGISKSQYEENYIEILNIFTIDLEDSDPHNKLINEINHMKSHMGCLVKQVKKLWN